MPYSSGVKPNFNRLLQHAWAYGGHILVCPGSRDPATSKSADFFCTSILNFAQQSGHFVNQIVTAISVVYTLRIPFLMIFYPTISEVNMSKEHEKAQQSEDSQSQDSQSEDGIVIVELFL